MASATQWLHCHSDGFTWHQGTETWITTLLFTLSFCWFYLFPLVWWVNLSLIGSVALTCLPKQQFLQFQDKLVEWIIVILLLIIIIMPSRDESSRVGHMNYYYTCFDLYNLKLQVNEKESLTNSFSNWQVWPNDIFGVD